MTTLTQRIHPYCMEKSPINQKGARTLRHIWFWFLPLTSVEIAYFPAFVGLFNGFFSSLYGNHLSLFVEFTGRPDGRNPCCNIKQRGIAQLFIQEVSTVKQLIQAVIHCMQNGALTCRFWHSLDQLARPCIADQ